MAQNATRGVSGDRITGGPGGLVVPDRPVIPFIRGDGSGPDIWRAAEPVLAAAVERAYGGRRRIAWYEVFAGQAAHERCGDWLPPETLEAFRECLVGIKGPLTTPVGGGIRSLNVTLRQTLDLYVCLRPVRYFRGVPSPVRRPELTDIVVFRENTEDIYAGIEFERGTEDCERFKSWLRASFPERFKRIRFPGSAAFSVKPISQEGSARLVRAAIRYAIENDRRSVALTHKGNIMKCTEGAFREWGYEVARQEFGAQPLDGGPWHVIKAGTPAATGRRRSVARDIVVKDVITDAFLEHILTRPQEYDVVAAMNLNGDYMSDALAACVGGIGIAPGSNVNFDTGHAIFEATHGTAPDLAGQDKANPGSVILSGEMMLRYLGWTEAADLIIAGMEAAIAARTVTFDFHRLMPDATLLKCSEFGQAVVAHMPA